MCSTFQIISEDVLPQSTLAEIGYMLHKELQGKGLMQEALETTLEYGFRVMNIHSVEANVNTANAASMKLLEKNGFQKESSQVSN